MKEQQSGQQNDIPQPLYVSLILDESGSMQSCKRAAPCWNRTLTRVHSPNTVLLVYGKPGVRFSSGCRQGCCTYRELP